MTAVALSLIVFLWASSSVCISYLKIFILWTCIARLKSFSKLPQLSRSVCIMFNLSILAVGSFALRCHCSYFGARPFNDVLNGLCGQLVFFFKPNHYGNLFFSWVRSNFDHFLIEERDLTYKGITYKAIFLKVPQRINKKFLFNFRKFSRLAPHLIHY